MINWNDLSVRGEHEEYECKFDCSDLSELIVIFMRDFRLTDKRMAEALALSLTEIEGAKKGDEEAALIVFHRMSKLFPIFTTKIEVKWQRPR